jgi:RNA polymerase sigma factor (sigma-70 family)
MKESEHVTKRREDFYLNYEEYRKNLYRYALKMTSNEAQAEEIADGTLVGVLDSMERRAWPEEIRDFNAYLIGSAKFRCIEWWRRPKEESLEGDEQSSQTQKALERKAMQDNNPTSRLENDIYYKELFRSVPLKVILSGLSEYEMNLLNMHAVEGLDAEEIAEALGKEPDSVKYQLNKLYAKIRYRARQLK